MYAEAEFSGVTPHKHGGSESDHIKALRAMGAQIPEDEAKIPAQLNYLYGIFKEIRFSRIPNNDSFSLMARESIGYSEVDYYSKISGLDFEKWEVDVLLSLNAIFDKAAN